MEVGKDVVTEVLGGNKKVFIIPLYQRNYSWQKKECLKLFNDILSMTKYQNIKDYFIGTIVYMQHKAKMNYTELTLIDGQQRLTTISLLLKAIATKMAANGLEDTNEIDSTYLKNKKAAQEEYGYVLKLKPNSKDAQTYAEIMEDKEVTDKSSNMYINYMNFLDWLDKKNDGKTYQEIFACIENVKLVYIILDKEDDPQVVFETINSTGKDLMFSDLIRNCILTSEKVDVQNDLYLNYWKPIEELVGNDIENFIRVYLQIQVEKVFVKSETYNTFKDFYTPVRHKASEIMDEMLRYAKIYQKLEAGYAGNKKYQDVCMIFNYLDYKLTYPFVMRLFYENEKGTVSDENVVKILKVLVAYIFRKTVVQTNLTQQFATLMVTMYNKINKYEDTYIGFLKNMFEQDSEKLRFVTDEQFIETLSRRDIYQSRFSDYMLKHIENSRSKEKIDYSNISKDHIMPQTPNEEWKKRIPDQEEYDMHKHRLGNLTLTAYNSEKGNKVKDIYKNSKISLNKDIDIETWGIERIEERGKELAEESALLWAFPDTSGISVGNAEKIFISFESIDEDEANKNEIIPSNIKVGSEKYTVCSWKETEEIIIAYLQEHYADKEEMIEQFIVEEDHSKVENIKKLLFAIDEELDVFVAIK